MTSLYEQLIQAIVQTGVSQDEARHAARRCALEMARQGFVGYLGSGALAYFLAMNPVSAMSFLAGGAVLGAGHAFARSPQCSEVREAISFWSSAPL